MVCLQRLGIKPNRHIVISGNRNSNAQQACITLASSHDVEVSGNTCSSTNLQGRVPDSINIQSSTRVAVHGNRRSGASTGGIMAVTGPDDRVTVQTDY